jgi:drug/metabolite transporter (DMT)-like permease
MLGLKAAQASSVSIWLNMELVMTAVIGCLFFRDHLDGRAWLGVGLTLAAGALACLGGGGGNTAASLPAALLVTAACTAWALDNHLTAVMAGIPAETVTFVKGLFGGVTNMVIGMIAAGGAPSAGPSLLALGVGAISYGVSILLYVTSAQSLGATRSQILFSTGPFWGILASFLILGERPLAPTLAAMACLAAGIAASASERHAHLHSHAALAHTHLHRHDDLHHGHLHDPALAPGAWHAHEHSHEALEHEHPHYPDLHHRHAH